MGEADGRPQPRVHLGNQIRLRRACKLDRFEAAADPMQVPIKFPSGSSCAVERQPERSSCRGERAGTRTPNLVIKSHLLYQLSYAPTASRSVVVRANEPLLTPQHSTSYTGFLASCGPGCPMQVRPEPFALGGRQQRLGPSRYRIPRLRRCAVVSSPRLAPGELPTAAGRRSVDCNPVCIRGSIR